MYHADRGIGQMDAHRQNNFDLLRIGAAALVFLSHCWSLTESGRDPADALMLHVFTGGELGVWIFFAISGYLVTASFMTRGSAIAFAKARILRIYPAFVAAIMYGIAVGAIVTRLPIADYFRSSETLSYLSGNLTFDIQYHLPGVFERNPHSSLVNRSLWTLPGEVFMYCVVGLLGAIGVLHRRPMATAVIASLVIMLAVWPTAILHLPLVVEAKLAAPMCCFLVGMALFVLGRGLPFRASAALLGLVLAAAVGEFASRAIASPFACAAITYATLTLALRSRPVHIPAAVGDISYGLYVYAYPTQQMVAWAFPGVGPWQMLAMAFPVTAGLAWCSWHLLEKRALALKGEEGPVDKSAALSRSKPTVSL